NYPNPDRAKQDTDEIEKASVTIMKEVIYKANARDGEILTVGISAAMHSLICLDEKITPLSQALIWSDTRSSQLAEQVIESANGKLYAKTGTLIHQMTPLIKLMSMKKENELVYEKATYFMSLKEYVLEKWFGKRVIDYSMASATGFFNVEELKWEKSALELAGIREEQLSEIVPPTEVLTGLDPEIAKEIGISEDVPFVIGAADGQLANLGSGAIEPGEVNISVGTSGAIRQFVKGAPVNKKMETFTYAFTDETSI